MIVGGRRRRGLLGLLHRRSTDEYLDLVGHVGGTRGPDDATEGRALHIGVVFDSQAHREAGMRGSRQGTPGRLRPLAAAVLCDLGRDTGVQVDVRRQAGRSSADAIQSDRIQDQAPPSLQGPGLIDVDANPARQPVDEIVRRQLGIKVAVEAVERAEQRRHDLVKCGHHPLAELVLLKCSR